MIDGSDIAAYVVVAVRPRTGTPAPDLDAKLAALVDVVVTKMGRWPVDRLSLGHIDDDAINVVGVAIETAASRMRVLPRGL